LKNTPTHSWSSSGSIAGPTRSRSRKNRSLRKNPHSLPQDSSGKRPYLVIGERFNQSRTIEGFIPIQINNGRLQHIFEANGGYSMIKASYLIDLQPDDEEKIIGTGSLDTRYGPGSGVIFRRIRRPPAASIAEFEINTGKKPNTIPTLPKKSGITR
jgi:hypothetical protein